MQYLLMIGLISVSLPAHASGTEAEVKLLIDRAETQVWLGISNKGASDAFEDGLTRLEEASALVDSSDLSADTRSILRRQIREVREQLEMLVELYGDRFYGVFPLARLLVPTLLAQEGFAVTEQLFHPPAVAAIEVAGRGFSAKVDFIDVPRVVFRSEPRDPLLENVAHSVLARKGKTIPVNRRGLLRALGPDALAAFDAGDVDTEMIARIMGSLDVESLIVATIEPRTGNGRDLVKYGMIGDLYQRGEAIQGGPADATPALRVATIAAYGTVLDRREQLRPILVLHAALLVVAMIVAVCVRWSTVTKLKPLYKMAIGVGLFLFGRIFAVAAIVVLGRVAPDPSDLIAASWWWPALLGLVTVLFGGAVVWLGQAKLTDVVPGARGARAVGTIFGLTALGGSCYFIAPELLLNQSEGYVTLAFFIPSTVALAVLFAFAIRTGPPVPTYFAIGPLVLTPFLGVSLLMDSLTGLWSVAALTFVLYVVATIRHRYAVAHGIEEQELDQEEAARVEQERLEKLAEKLKR
jgi:hypothetical protein